MTMPITRSALKKFLDGEEFYNLCQIYRTTPVTEPVKVLVAFKNLQAQILKQTKGPR